MTKRLSVIVLGAETSKFRCEDCPHQRATAWPDRMWCEPFRGHISGGRLVECVEAEARVSSGESNEIATLRADLARVTAEKREALAGRDIAVEMLAGWCAAVDQNGTGWDDWDEHYKDAMYRDTPLRALLDAAISEAKALYLRRGSGV